MELMIDSESVFLVQLRKDCVRDDISDKMIYRLVVKAGGKAISKYGPWDFLTLWDISGLPYIYFLKKKLPNLIKEMESRNYIIQ